MQQNIGSSTRPLQNAFLEQFCKLLISALLHDWFERRAKYFLYDVDKS